MKKILGVLLAITIIGLVIIFASDEKVVFNTYTLKYHKPSCEWAKKCTQNCIKISKKKAQQQGGVPCKVCGG